MLGARQRSNVEGFIMNKVYIVWFEVELCASQARWQPGRETTI